MQGLRLTVVLTVAAGGLVVVLIKVWGGVLGLVPDGHTSLSAVQLGKQAAEVVGVIGLVLSVAAAVRAWSTPARPGAGPGSVQELPQVRRFVRADG